jgi:hypothetical protein
MSRAINDATVWRNHGDDDAQFEQPLNDSIAAHSILSRLETLKRLTPDEFIRER